MNADARAVNSDQPRVPLLPTLVIVMSSGAALGLSFLALSQTTGQLRAVPYLAISLCLCVTPGLVLRAVRNRVSLPAVACVTGTTVFCLTTVYGLHCRYFLAGSPRGALVLVGVLVTGFVWIVMALAVLALVLVPRDSLTRDGIGVSLLLGIPLAVRWLAVIVLPFALIWLSPSFVVVVLAVPVVTVLLELTGNSLLLAVLRRYRRPTVPLVQQILEELSRRTSDRMPEVVQIGAHWPPICQVRLRLPGVTSIVVSDQAIDRFTNDGLRAVLAHEWAHIRFRHLHARVAGDAFFAVAVVAGLWPASRVLSVIDWPGGYAAGLALYVFTAASGRHLLMMSASRRLERAADAFARDMMGAEAVSEALKATEGADAPEILAAFSSHGSVAARRRSLSRSSR